MRKVDLSQTLKNESDRYVLLLLATGADQENKLLVANVSNLTFVYVRLFAMLFPEYPNLELKTLTIKLYTLVVFYDDFNQIGFYSLPKLYTVIV